MCIQWAEIIDRDLKIIYKVYQRVKRKRLTTIINREPSINFLDYICD